MPNYDYERKIFGYLNNVKNVINTRPLNLGGVNGSSGGTGGPPGGFIGKLPQSRIAFDTDEYSIWDVPPSGVSLVTNLNRIRYRLDRVEASGVGGAGSVTIFDDGVEITSNVTSIDFVGGTVSYIDNDVTVELGGSSLTQEQIEDYVGGMVTGNTETGIAVTYDDGAGKLNFDASHTHIVTASGIGTDFTNFNNNLSASDDTVQKALDTLDNLTIGAGTPTFHGCYLYKSGNQNVSAGGSDAVTWDSEVFDTDAYHAGSDSYVTIPAGLAGKYLVVFNLAWASYMATNKHFAAFIHITSTSAGNRRAGQTNFVASGYTYISVSVILDLAEGATVMGLANNGDSATTAVLGAINYTSFSIQYLGA